MSSTQPIRIHVSHCDPVTQAGLSSALAAYADLEVVNHAAARERDGADVVIADFDRGVDLLGRTSSERRTDKVVIVTSNDREFDIRHALKSGARAYLLQGCSLDELALAIREAHAGCVYLGAVIGQRLAESICRDALTPREEEVLRQVVEGLCNKEIARRLDLAVGTVKSHLRAVYAKLEVKTRTRAAAVAARRGLLRQPPDASSVHLDDAALDRERGGMRAVAGVELGQDVLHA